MPFFTYTQPNPNVHPRPWLTPGNLASIVTRKNTTHSSDWATLRSWVVARQVASGTYVNSYYDNKEFEYTAAFAFAHSLEPTTAWATRGRDIALYLAGKAIPSSHTKRQYLLAMAFVYSWLYAFLTESERQTLRNRCEVYIDAMTPPNANEFVWGTDHGDIIYAMGALACIMGDGSAAQNSKWVTQMDSFMNFMYDGTNDQNYFSLYRHFGDIDGGSYKGMGPFSYTMRNEEFHVRLFPIVQTALGLDWFTTEVWWTKTMHWNLWSWRPDRTTFRMGENSAFSNYGRSAQIHAWQVAARENNTFGEQCQWYAQEIADRDAEDTSDSASTVFGPFMMYPIMFKDTTRVVTLPTIANTGGLNMRVFERAGIVACRSGWTPTDTASIFKVPRYYLAGHSKRDNGAVHVAAARPLSIESGLYDPNQTVTYKDPASSTNTGHRVTYSKRVLAQSVCRIFDTDEVTENEADSFRQSSGASSRFGVLSGGVVAIKNDGGQLWPKSAGGLYQPGDLAQLLAEPKWNYAGFDGYTPTETANACYAVANLTPCYYSAKCTSYRRHFVWVKRGTIPGWPHDVILTVDDLSTHVDGVAGKLTQVWQLQTLKEPSGAANAFTLDVDTARMFMKIVGPASVEWTKVSGFKDLEGNVYAPTDDGNFDDIVRYGAGTVWRTEVNPASSGGTQRFVAVWAPCTTNQVSGPACVLISDGTYIGATIGGIDVKVKLAAPYALVVGSSTDVTAPSTPANPSATPGNQLVTLNWDDSTDNVAVSHYEIERRVHL